MPIYEYQCENCNHALEIIQKINDPPPLDCPGCELPKLRKKVSAVAFRLAGGGWYETDFKTGEKKNLVGDSEKTNKSASDNKGVKETSSKEKNAEKKTSEDKKPSKKSETKKPAS